MRRFLFVCLVVAACTSQENVPLGQLEQELASEIPGTHTRIAFLGQAYSKTRSRILPAACVDVTQTLIEVADSDVKFERNMEADNIIKTINGNLNVGMTFPAVNAGVSVDVAYEDSSDTLNDTYNVYFVGLKNIATVSLNSAQINSKGLEVVNEHNNQLEFVCGDEYVSEIHYGASMFATMAVEFVNETDKLEIQGKLNVDVAGGMVSADASLNYLDKKVKERTNIKVHAQQLGGDAAGLLDILPDNIANCKLSDPQPCFNAMASLIKYMKGGFKTTLADQKYWVPIKFGTQRYDESGLFKLVPPQGYPEMDMLVKLTRDDIEEKFAECMEDIQKARKVKKNLGSMLTPALYDEVENIYKAAKSNLRIWADAAKYCLDNPNQSCVDREREYENLLTDYDRKRLDFNYEDLKCERARRFCLENQMIPQSMYERLVRANQAPVFRNPDNWREGIVTYLSCDIAAQQL